MKVGAVLRAAEEKEEGDEAGEVGSTRASIYTMSSAHSMTPTARR